MPAELTTPTPRANTYGLACLEHPSHNRDGLGLAHAQNAVAKHNRDHHAEPMLNVTALAALLLDAWDDHHLADMDPDPDKAWARTSASHRLNALQDAWGALTGLDPAKALEYARQVGTLQTPVTAAILPF